MHEEYELKDRNGIQTWDVARETPIITDEQKPSKLLSLIQIVTCTVVGFMVFALAFFSKTSLLLLINLCSQQSKTLETKVYAFLFLGCILIAPSVLTLIKCTWKMTFKNSKSPSTQTLIWVVLVETLVALGSSIITLIAMPNFDILTNVMLLNGVAMLSAMLQVVANAVAHGRRRFIMTSIAAVVIMGIGYCLFAINYLKGDDGNKKMGLFLGLAIAGTYLVSLNWWENYATLFKIVFFHNTIRDIHKSRNFVGIVASVVRIVVTFTVLGAFVKLSGMSWPSVLSVDLSTKTIVLSLFAIQVISSALCRWFAVAACKMHAVRRCFIIPLIFASPAALTAFVLAIWIPFLTATPGATSNNVSFYDYCQTFDVVKTPGLSVMNAMLTDLTFSMCNHTVYSGGTVASYSLLGGSLVSWWIGLILCTLYIWFLNTQRIARTSDLFMRNLYEAAFIDQSMLLNTKFEIVQQSKNNSTKETERVTIYLCATMWHETADEMLKMIISMFRIDKFRPKRNQYNDVSFESHIYFDDAFVTKDNKRHVNEYAETLAEVIKQVYIIFTDDGKNVFRERRSLPKQKIIQTPYGCRLQYTLPHGNSLFVHMKDKHKIRHKKRWSQIMYMYYLLGWKLHRKFYLMRKDEPNVEEILNKAKENTYILALDGDTDFQPSAVMLLVDRLKLYSDVGAACGRIHPTGTGPMVWYQKFEYAVGHWLQKTAEHVFGCVLCSPGCFSLMRASALMSDNVMKKYTTKATEAAHYLQYDQGEDRWLCTLVLQQGWRVEYSAASDSYTNAPQEFKEFYNQRRRWGPSTMANTLDLLSSGKLTAQLNKSISLPYILYQTITMAASILGPATVCLMIAGSFKIVLNIEANGALTLAILPPVIYLILCLYLGHSKSDIQITIAAILSICYAFLMTGTMLSIVASLVGEGTFMTPSGLFFISMIILYLGTALLHPHECHLVIYGLLYVICIPSGYLLLAIYSMTNMNNVSWGTRESSTPKTPEKETVQKNVKCQKILKLCGYNLEFQVNKEQKVVCAEQPVISQQPDTPQQPETSEPAGTSKPKNVSLKKTQKRQLTKDFENKERENSDFEDEDSEDEDFDYKGSEVENCGLENSFIKQLKKSSGELYLKDDYLEEEEEKFWVDLIDEYLKPLENNKAKEDKITSDLKDLRNKATFVFFICNALWLVTTFFLQALGSGVTIPIPKVYPNGTVDDHAKIFIDPIGLMFLLSFASLLFIQFLAMLWHRVQTLIHFIAYNGTVSVANRKMRKQSLKQFKRLNSEDNFL